MDEKNHETHSDHLEEEIKQKLGQITARANKEEDDRQARCDRLEEETKQGLNEAGKDFRAELEEAKADFKEMKQEIGDFAAVTSDMAKDRLRKLGNFLKKR